MKSAFLILGAQRSGTSVISHSLSQFGIDFGHPDHFIQGQHNPIFFELGWVNAVNNKLVNFLGYKYIDFFLPLATDFDRQDVANLQNEIVAQLQQEWGESTTIALKDPRFSLTFPVWENVLKQLDYQLNIIFAFRCPAGFLASNQRLFHQWDGWNQQRHLNFWLQFNLAAIYFTHNYSPFWVNYDELIANPLQTVAALAAYFQLDTTAIATATSVIDPAEYHHQRIEKTGFPIIDQYYDRLCQHDINPEDYLNYRQQWLQSLSASSQILPVI